MAIFCNNMCILLYKSKWPKIMFLIGKFKFWWHFCVFNFKSVIRFFIFPLKVDIWKHYLFFWKADMSSNKKCKRQENIKIWQHGRKDPQIIIKNAYARGWPIIIAQFCPFYYSMHTPIVQLNFSNKAIMNKKPSKGDPGPRNTINGICGTSGFNWTWGMCWSWGSCEGWQQMSRTGICDWTLQSSF